MAGEDQGAGSSGAAGRGLGGPGGDHAGSGPAGLGGVNRAAADQRPGGLDARNLGGGGEGDGQTQGVARQNQAFGLGGAQEQADAPTGGLNEQQDALRAHAAAQTRPDAADAEGLLDKTRAQPDIPGADPNNNAL